MIVDLNTCESLSFHRILREKQIGVTAKFSPKREVTCSDAKDAVDLLELVPRDLEALVRLGDELTALVEPNKKKMFESERLSLRNEHTCGGRRFFSLIPRSHWMGMSSYWIDAGSYRAGVLSYRINLTTKKLQE